MRSYDTAEGDSIRVACAAAGIEFADDVAVAIAEGEGDGADGVLTTAAHADELHDLFERGARFSIEASPADEDRTERFAGCRLLSSSGKWYAPATDPGDGE